MTPACFNRPLAPASYTRHGFDSDTGEPITVELHRWFEDKCATWLGTGIGPNNEPYPVALGWVEACRTCRWMPEGVFS